MLYIIKKSKLDLIKIFILSIYSIYYNILDILNKV